MGRVKTSRSALGCASRSVRPLWLPLHCSPLCTASPSRLVQGHRADLLLGDCYPRPRRTHSGRVFLRCFRAARRRALPADEVGGEDGGLAKAVFVGERPRGAEVEGVVCGCAVAEHASPWVRGDLLGEFDGGVEGGACLHDAVDEAHSTGLGSIELPAGEDDVQWGPGQ